MASRTSFRRKAIAAARQAGWRVETLRGEHTKLYPPDGSRPVILSKGTGSTSGRAMANIKADLKRKGLEL